MEITITTIKLLALLSESYRKGVEDQKNSNVTPRSEFEGTEGTLMKHLRINE